MNSEQLDILIGGVPVSEQLGAALERMATKDHMHIEYATHDEIEELKKKIEVLMGLIGDMSVSEQIYAVLNNMK